MTILERTLPIYDWARMAGEASRYMRLTPGGYFMTANVNGFWKCSACNASGRSLDEHTAQITVDEHARSAHENEEVRRDS